MPRLADVAKASKVSPAIVSRVANGDRSLKITAETRRRVERAIREMGYTPNRAAQSLRSAESGFIALAVHDLTNPVYGEIARGAGVAAARIGKALVMSDSSERGAETDRLPGTLIDLVGGHGVDGLILQANGGTPDQVLALAAREKTPMVVLQADIGIGNRVVLLPDEKAARLATEHLIGLGHTRIGCLATNPGLIFTEARVAGWRRTLKAHELRHDDTYVVHAPATIEAGADAIESLLARSGGLTGLVCCNIVPAIGAMMRLIDHGHQVPGDMSIVAVHDIPMAPFLKVPMTTVAMPLFDMGVAAVEALADGGSDDGGPGRIIDTDPRLIVRASTGPATLPAHHSSDPWKAE